MKKLLLITVGVLMCIYADAQMTLAHRFPGFGEITQVNLSISGKKILVLPNIASSPGSLDTLFFYNPDYSYWKMIPCPHIMGHLVQTNFHSNEGRAISVFYPSETLFNTDPLLEVAVAYYDSLPTPGRPTIICIINENGVIVDSITNVHYGAISSFHVSADNSGNYKAYVSKMDGTEIYDLPGSLPCETCVNSSIGMLRKSEILTTPMPNPSQDNVKITFTLPRGADRGELQLYNSNGVRIKTFQVDNRFGFIMLDNSQLNSGIYFYNIVVGNTISSTQKLVVLK